MIGGVSSRSTRKSCPPRGNDGSRVIDRLGRPVYLSGGLMFRNTKMLAGLFMAAGGLLGWAAASAPPTLFQRADAAPPVASRTAETPPPALSVGPGCCPDGATDLRLARADAIPATLVAQLPTQAAAAA